MTSDPPGRPRPAVGFRGPDRLAPGSAPNHGDLPPPLKREAVDRDIRAPAPAARAGARNVLKESHDRPCGNGPLGWAALADRCGSRRAGVAGARTKPIEGARQARERTQPCQNDRPALSTRLVTVRDIEPVGTRR
jgi:hypothetical protein